MKPEIKLENGKLKVSAGHQVDADKDGKVSATIAVQLELDAAEVISEIVKKDMSLLEAILKQVKI